MTTPKIFGLLTLTLALAVQVQAQSFLTKGLVAYYPFTGNANDASGYNNNQILNTNTPTLADDQFGRSNAAAYFSAAEEIQYASPAQIEAITNATVSCWVQTTNYYSGFAGLVCKATATYPVTGFQVGVHHGRVQVLVDATAYTGNIHINDGQWHAIGVVLDHANRQVGIFVDGNLDVTNSTPVTSPGAAANLTVGADWQGLNFYGGALDEVRLFNRALTTTEIAQLYDVESAELSLPYLNLAISLSLAKQSATNVVGTLLSAANPALSVLATKNLLGVVAADEQVEGSWPSNSFPQNATLALAGSSFVVLNGTNMLLNVTDLMSFHAADGKVVSGKQNLATGLAYPTTQQVQMAGITFDDTFIPGGNLLKFYVNGVLTQTLNDVTGSNGFYTETQTFKLATAAGDGTVQGVPFICTGAATATAKRLLHL